MYKSSKAGAEAVGRAMFSKTEVSGMIQNTLQALGAPAMVGTTFGIMMQTGQELADTFRLGGRIGINFSDTLLETTAELANVGLDLGEFSQIVGTNISGVRQFGDSTQKGANRLLKMIKGFEIAATGFGNFGFTSGQSAEFLAEELELRRKTMTLTEFQNMQESELVSQMVQRIKSEESLAKITGMDVRDRLKAQQEARNNAIAQSYLAEQSDETREKFSKLAGGLAAMGTVGKDISKAILTAISTGLRPEQFSTVFPRLDGGSELFDMVDAGMTNGSQSVEDFAAQVAQSVSALKQNNADLGPQLRIMAANGDQDAMTLLGLRADLIDINKGEITAREQHILNLEEADKKLMDAKARGLAQELEILEKQMQNVLLKTAISAAGAATGNFGTGPAELIMTFLDLAQAGMSSDLVGGTIEGISQVAGKYALGPFVSAADGTLTTAEMGALVQMFGRNLPGAAGTAANIAGIPQGAQAVKDMMNRATTLTTEQEQDLAATGTYTKTDLQKVAEKLKIVLGGGDPNLSAEEQERQRINAAAGADNTVKLLPDDMKTLAELIRKQTADNNNSGP